MNGYGYGNKANTVNLISASTPVPSKPDAPVDAATNRLAMATQSLSEAVGHLCDRLTPVLTPAGIAPNNVAAVQLKPETPLSEAIGRQADKVYDLREQLGDLLNRLGLS